MGSGFHELQASLTAVKRLDPLALIGSISYEKAFEEDDIEPGDEIGLSLGVSLAASPETALSATLQQTYSYEDEIDGREIAGSRRRAGLFC